MAPAEFAKFTAGEADKWAKVIKFAGINHTMPARAHGAQR